MKDAISRESNEIQKWSPDCLRRSISSVRISANPVPGLHVWKSGAPISFSPENTKFGNTDHYEALFKIPSYFI